MSSSRANAVRFKQQQTVPWRKRVEQDCRSTLLHVEIVNLQTKLSFLNDTKDLAALARRAARQAQLANKKRFQSGVVRNPPPDIAHHPAKVSLFA